MLGARLKQLREQSKETVAEVSGAVEIDSDVLAGFELGKDRPSEDILLLLISHFSTKDDEAITLWRLAGYDERVLQDRDTIRDYDDADDKQGAMVLPMDLRIVYTDMVHVLVNDFGLVMNFLQTSGVGNKPLAIARVGMSREHAQSVLEVLQKTLAQTEPKALPSPEAQSDTSDNAEASKQKSE